jgi:hypothetical protein
LNNSHIWRIGEKPIILKYVDSIGGINSFDSNSLSDVSDISDVVCNSNLIVATESTGNHDYDFDCYYCDDCKTSNKDVYEQHIITKHPGKLCYPGKADLEKLAITLKDKSWEI